VLADGTIVVTARRWEAGVPTFVAKSWRGPYVAQPVAPVVLVRAGAPAADAFSPFDEDPFLYENAGGFHMITHRQPNGTNCPPVGNDSSDCRCAGGHMYTANLTGGPWFVDLDLAFNCTLAVAGAPAPLKLHARQRPTVLFPPRGAAACPLLFTGASTDPVSQYYSSFTMVQEIDC